MGEREVEDTRTGVSGSRESLPTRTTPRAIGFRRGNRAGRTLEMSSSLSRASASASASERVRPGRRRHPAWDANERFRHPAWRFDSDFDEIFFRVIFFIHKRAKRSETDEENIFSTSRSPSPSPRPSRLTSTRNSVPTRVVVNPRSSRSVMKRTPSAK